MHAPCGRSETRFASLKQTYYTQLAATVPKISFGYLTIVNHMLVEIIQMLLMGGGGGEGGGAT